MLKHLLMSSAVTMFALLGSASGQELASRSVPMQTQVIEQSTVDPLKDYRLLADAFGDLRRPLTPIPASVDGDDAAATAIFARAGISRGPLAQIRHSVPDFSANFDRAARTSRSVPLAPGSAEIP
jgi:hypothetical protein